MSEQARLDRSPASHAGPIPFPGQPFDGAPLLAAEDLAFEVGGERLIDGIDLDIRPGRKLFILGPNGAGKSLLLRLLHGLITPTAGRILWKGEPLGKAARARQAMVFQRPVLLRRSVAANLRYGLSVRGVPAAERSARLAEALASAGLEALSGRGARVLSGGEQQRLAMARALSLKPELLFLDEPTSSLDPTATQAIEALIGKAHDEGVTIVMVTHDLGQARRLADDVVFMTGGRLAEAGTAERFFAGPRSAAAQAFLQGRLVL